MKQSFYFLVLFLSLGLQTLSAVEQTPQTRDYHISLGTSLQESRVAASGGILLNKLAYDAYWGGLVDSVPESAQPWIGPLWNFFWTFNFSMWPHDMGHWIRANQAGGDFVIDKYQFPFPVSRMVDAPDATPAEQTLMSAGGFEINTLMRQQHERLYYQAGHRDAADMVHSFIQTIFFPMYTLLIAPNDPDSTNTWEETYGDPADYTKLVFQHYTGRPLIRADNSVDPTLARLYREIFWTNLVTVLIDPMMYKSFRGMMVDLKQRPRIGNPWLYETDEIAWAYTTLFNPGAIGYEVYLTQHLKIFDNYLSFYIRAGRPFKNRGVGIRMPSLFEVRKLSIGGSAEIWDQDVYGKGYMLTLSPAYRIHRSMTLSLDMHWKDRGYVIGHRLDKDMGVLLNGTYYW